MSSPPQLDFVLVDDADVRDFNEAGLLPQPRHVLSQITAWLKPTAYDDATSEYLRHLQSHVPGTGDWLAATDEFTRWLAPSGHNVLWIRALPGAGKSVLAAHARAYLATSQASPVLHFFFRQIITANRTPIQLTRDWLAQLLPYAPSLQAQLFERFVDSGRRLESVNLDELWDFLRAALRSLGRVYCFADALDEMSVGYESFLIRLVQLGDLPGCRLLMTSRPVSRIVGVLRKESLLQLTLGPHNLDDDIAHYVDHRLEHDIGRYVDHRLRASGLDFCAAGPEPDIAALIRSVLREKAQGSFLYARLTMDALLAAITNPGLAVDPQHTRRALDQLPTGLSEMYREMLRDHSARTGTSEELQRTILQWITHSERPLRMLELTAAIDFQGQALRGQSKDTKATVRTGCGPLIEILPSDVVGPLHHSFTEFLTSPSAGTEPAAFHTFDARATHLAIAKQCIAYLIHVVPEVSARPPPTIGALKLKYPFFDYALSYWNVHLRAADEVDTSVLDLMDDLLGGNRAAQKFLAGYLVLGGDYDTDSCDPRFRLDVSNGGSSGFEDSVDSEEDIGDSEGENVDPEKGEQHPFGLMHVAAAAGLGSYVTHLHQKAEPLDAKDNRQMSPIHYAAAAGHLQALKCLVAAGANANPSEQCGLTPLHTAACNDHAELVDCLLSSGVDPQTPKTREDPGRWCGNAPTTTGDTAVEYACRAGHLRTIKVFTKYLDADGLAIALRWALYYNKPESALLLIQDERLDVDQLAMNQTPLLIAARNRDVRCMKALLDRGASASKLSSMSFSHGGVNSHSSSLSSIAYTPLHAFTSELQQPRWGIVEESRSQCEEQIRALDMLIDAGCPIDAEDPGGNTALCGAQSRYRVASHLLSRGADPQKTFQGSLTPLHTIAGKDRQAMELWMSHGLDINAPDDQGRPPLLLAAESRDCESLRTLIALGADVDVRDPYGRSVLHILGDGFISDQDVQIVRDLTAAGADPNARTIHGNTPAHTCKVDYRDAVFSTLLECGTDANALNSAGETWFLHQAHSGFGFNDKNLGNMLKLSPVINHRDSQGRTALHVMCAKHHDVTKWRKMIAAGADPAITDNAGNTVLHYVAGFKVDKYHAAEYKAFVARVLESGQNIRCRNLAGQSPLLVACACNNVAFFRVLQERGLPVDSKDADNQGISALHLAAVTSPLITLALLRLGGSPWLRTRRGRTPIHFAAQARQAETLAILLHHLPNSSDGCVDAEDTYGRTALDYACRCGQPEVVRQLLDAGAAASHLDATGSSVMSACAEFHEECRLWEVAALSDYPSRHAPMLDDRVREALNLRERDIPRALAVKARETQHRYQYQGRAQSIPPSLRLTLRYLIAAGAATVSNDQVKQSGVPYRRIILDEAVGGGRALDGALYRGSDIMHEELAGASHILDCLRDYDLNRRSAAERKYRADLVRRHREAQREALKVLTPGNIWFDVVYDLLDRDQADDLSILQDVGVDLTTLQTWNPQQNVFEILVDQGRHDVVRRLSTSLDVEMKQSKIVMPNCWPQKLWEHTMGDDVAAQFKPLDELLTGMSGGLLLRALQRDIYNMDTVKLIVEEFGCSQVEMTWALFSVLSSETWWHMQAIKYLIAQGVDVNTRDPSGRTPLLAACRRQYGDQQFLAPTVQCLLDCGADPNKADNAGNSCLHEAAWQPEIFLMLLMRGADPNAHPSGIMIKAIQSQHVEVVKALIQRGVDVNGISQKQKVKKRAVPSPYSDDDDEWDTAAPLIFASLNLPMTDDAGTKKTRQSMMRALLEAGADPLLETSEGRPIVHGLLAQGPTVRAILEQPGLDLEARDCEGRTLLLASSANNNVAQGSRADKSDVDFFLLLELGADIHAVDNKSRNVLHALTATLSTLESLEGVLQRPNAAALVHARDVSGKLPVHLALECQDWKQVALLMASGADISVADPSGNTAFHHMARDFAKPFVRGIREHYSSKKTDPASEAVSDTDMGSDEKNTTEPTVEEVMDKLRPQVAEPLALFVKKGIDLNALNDDGKPALFNFLRKCPLMKPRYHGDTRTGPGEFVAGLRLLQEAGVDIYRRSRDGQSGLHALARRSFTKDSSYREDQDTSHMRQAWQYLVQQGLDPLAEDEEQRSALDVAAAAGNTTVLEMY